MGNEVTIRASLSFEKGGTTVQLALGPLLRDVAGTDHQWKSQQVGFAAEELLDLGDVAVGGYFLFVNRDPTNFVSIRAVSGATALVQLKPGDFALLRISPGATPYVIADTAAVRLEFLGVDL